MKPQLRTNRGNIGNEIFGRIPDLSMYPSTFTDEDISVGASSVIALDPVFLAAADYIVLGDPMTPQAEIVKVSSRTGKTLALTSTTVYGHDRGTRITFIPFNQIVIMRSTNDGASYSDLATQDLQMYNAEHYYNHTAGASTDMYKIRFYNATAALSSDNSDGVLATGYAANTVFSVKKRAMEAMGKKIWDLYKPGSKITDEFLNEKLYELRRTLHGVIDRWSFRQEFDYKVGRVVAGTNRIACPAILSDPNTDKNALSIRIGSHRPQLEPMTKREFNQTQQGIRHTTLAAELAQGATSATLTDSGDFEETGTIDIVTAGVKDTIDFSANDESTNVLTVSGVDTTHAAGTDVWQNTSMGLPTRYVIFDGYIYFDLPIDAMYHNENIMADFYRTVPPVDSDADTFDEPEYDMFVYGLKWAIRAAEQDGVMPDPDTDPDHKMMVQLINMLVGKERGTEDLKFIPVLPDVEP